MFKVKFYKYVVYDKYVLFTASHVHKYVKSVIYAEKF